MARRKLGEEKSRCMATFTVPIHMRFSVSGTDSERIQLEKKVDETGGKDISELFRMQFLDLLDVKTLVELDDMLYEEIELVKKKCLKKIGVNRKIRLSTKLKGKLL